LYKIYEIIITIAFFHSENLNPKSHLLNLVWSKCHFTFSI